MFGGNTGGPAPTAPGGLGALFKNPMMTQLLLQMGLGMMGNAGARPGQPKMGFGQGMAQAGLGALQNIQSMQQQSFLNNLAKQRLELEDKRYGAQLDQNKWEREASQKDAELRTQQWIARLNADTERDRLAQAADERRFKAGEAAAERRFAGREQPTEKILEDWIRREHGDWTDAQVAAEARKQFLQMNTGYGGLLGGFGQGGPMSAPPGGQDAGFWDLVEQEAAGGRPTAPPAPTVPGLLQQMMMAPRGLGMLPF